MVCLLVAALVAATPFSALAASQLTGLVVIPSRSNAVRIALNFAGGVPAGWAVTGAGTQTPTVVLPATTAASSISQAAYQGSGAVSSVTVTQNGLNLSVVLHLTASAIPIASHAQAGSILIDVAAPPATPSVSPAPAAPPTTGDIGNGQNYTIIPLKYADVSEVVGLLVQGQQVQPNDVFNPEGSIFSLPTSNNGIPTQSGPSPFTTNSPQTASFGERVNDNIGYDRRLNAIIIYGTPQQIAQYKSFIASIDIPEPSVMLECQVIELDESGAKNLGIDFTNGNGGIATGAASLGPLNNGSGFTTSPNITAQLQAQLFDTIEHGGGKILATPRVLALNGQSAQILSGDALPILSTIIYPGSTVTTQQNVNYVAVGINMQIQPRIDPGGYVTSHIFAEVSSVTQYIQTSQGQVPQISLRQVSTEATVQDGQSFVVGGLLKDEEITSLSKIPGFGDLPLIGGFFRVRHDTTDRTNLYIFITPHIIHTLGVQNQSNTRVNQLPTPEVPGPLPHSNATPTPPPAQPLEPLVPAATPTPSGYMPPQRG
ncbi:MAG TPA: secretin N-terminal domain-containing protein [Candidatus Acidoferrales bacterium]|nr:secretin N-terminal domain-containing protein [Candidatus Acidoferrales bacterium]